MTYERYYGKLRTDLEATCLDGKVLVVPPFSSSSSGGKTQDDFHLTACEVLFSSLVDKTGQSLLDKELSMYQLFFEMYNLHVRPVNCNTVVGNTVVCRVHWSALILLARLTY